MNNKGEFLHALEANTGVLDRGEAEKITAVVLRTLATRLTPQEADQVEAQLPKDLKPIWRGNVLQQVAANLRGQSEINLDQFVDEVMKQTHVSRDRALELTKAVFHLLKEQITQGEADDVAGQLPQALKIIWMDA